MPNTETIFGDSRQTNTVRPGQPGERRKGPVKKKALPGLLWIQIKSTTEK
ncbi:MAG: hypothetical protein BWY39_00111 [Spirochaetes bacterium ADurb.Bin269]|nr:MAG: hypothetical protein BWY39_00111 [Spirochaetes bacterium ADurb.Bin269]